MLVNSSSVDRLVELVLEEDTEVLKTLLTTNQAVTAPTGSPYFSNRKKRVSVKDNLSKTDEIEVKKETSPTKEDSEKDSLKRLFQDSNLDKEERLSALRKWYKQKLKNKKANLVIDLPKGKELSAEDTRIMARVGYPTFEKGSLRPERVLTTYPEGERLGILTSPAWLVSHSDAMDNHAIHRGRWIRERLLGGGVPDVPITVDAQLPDEPEATLRERMRVTREKYCWTCHEKMDPLGLPFEMYNHVGLYRKTEHGEPVDSSGEIIDSGDSAIDGPVADAHDLIKKLAESERVEQVFVRHAFRYWMGRNETLHDAPVLQAAHKAYRDNGGSMNALIISLVTSDAFLYRK